MKPALLAFLAATATATLFERQDNGSYVQSICNPPIANPTDTVPPCIEIQTIETACTPNGTAPIDLIAHGECMCGGSFFADWTGCLQCLYVHGGRSPVEVTYYSSVIASVSTALCTGTPTADFQDLFASAQAAITMPTTGNTQSSDQYPSQTAVSLYFTASGPQGPGAITGSATAATNTGGSSSSAATTSHGSSGGSSSTGSSSKPTSTNAAAPTAALGGFWLAAAGGAIVAAL